MQINPKRRLDLLVLLVALCLCKVLDNCAFKTIIILALDSNQFINLPFTGGGGKDAIIIIIIHSLYRVIRSATIS